MQLLLRIYVIAGKKEKVRNMLRKCFIEELYGISFSPEKVFHL